LAEMLELVERAKRGMAHWLMFASTSIGFFIWGLIMTLGFLAYPQFHSFTTWWLSRSSPSLGTC